MWKKGWRKGKGTGKEFLQLLMGKSAGSPKGKGAATRTVTGKESICKKEHFKRIVKDDRISYCWAESFSCQTWEFLFMIWIFCQRGNSCSNVLDCAAKLKGSHGPGEFCGLLRLCCCANSSRRRRMEGPGWERSCGRAIPAPASLLLLCCSGLHPWGCLNFRDPKGHEAFRIVAVGTEDIRIPCLVSQTAPLLWDCWELNNRSQHHSSTAPSALLQHYINML